MKLDTDLKTNIAYVRPYLGIILVGCVALGFALILYNATSELTQTIHTTPPVGIEGTMSIKGNKEIRYGDTVTYKSTTSGGVSQVTNTYITTVCFQGDEMVFQKSTQQGVPVYLYDQMGGSFEWDGKPASCSATLMFREVNSDSIDVYIVDALSFEVNARP